MKILKSSKIVITRSESNFDKACDEAYNRAIRIMKIDDCGHSNIKGWDRSSCFIRVIFDKYEQTGGMGGQEYTYAFRAEL